MTDWIILRCASSQTLALASSLNEAGFEAWTPAVARTWREGESRTRKSATVAGTPCYVFAAANQLADLLALSHAPDLSYLKWDAEQGRMVSRGHPTFSVMRNIEGYGLVTDRELLYLRRVERQDVPKKQVRPYTPGEQTRVIDGPYQGLSGVVIGTHGVHVQIEFPQSTLLHSIPIWMLHHVDEMEAAA